MPQHLYLIPNLLSENSESFLFPPGVAEKICKVRLFFVEEEKTARKLLKKISADFPIAECKFYPLSEHSTPGEIQRYGTLLTEDAGIISQAGCPCVADPGGDLVLLAHRQGIEVVPLVGPSSILLALMASGLNGQNFAFVGYLPKEQTERIQKIKELEKRSLLENQTQIFMDTPYRNQHVFDDVINHCHQNTLLCIASNMSGPEETIKTMPVGTWKAIRPTLKKNPTLFLILQ